MFDNNKLYLTDDPALKVLGCSATIWMRAARQSG